jgi:CheY-like chemotaxis protein
MTKRILLADDDADDRLIFEEIFSEMPEGKFDLISVGNGEEVMSFLNTITDPNLLPNLVILDQNMPLMSGKDTLIAIKNSPMLRAIPVIIYSTYNDSSFIESCNALGVKAVISKPDSFEGYAEMVNELLTYSSEGKKISSEVR